MDKINSTQNKKYLYELWTGRRKGSFAFEVPIYRRNPPSCAMPPLAYTNYEIFSDKEKHLRSQLDYVENRILGRDNGIAAMNPVAFGFMVVSTAFGSTYDPMNNWTSQCITSPEEIRKLKRPDLSCGLIPSVLERINYFVEETNGEIPVYLYDIQSPVAVASTVMDDQEMLIAMYTHPGEVHYLLQTATDLIIDFIKEMKKIIPEYVPSNLQEVYFPKELGISMSDDWAAIISPSLYEQFNLKYINRISEEFGGIFLHSCGDIRKNLDNLKKIKNLRGLNFGASECPFEDVVKAFEKTDVLLVPHIGLNNPIHFWKRVEYAGHIISKKTDSCSVFMLCYESNAPISTSESFNEDSEEVLRYVKECSTKGQIRTADFLGLKKS